jgi:hypothetical protein
MVLSEIIGCGVQKRRRQTIIPLRQCSSAEVACLRDKTKTDFDRSQSLFVFTQRSGSRITS